MVYKLLCICTLMLSAGLSCSSNSDALSTLEARQAELAQQIELLESAPTLTPQPTPTPVTPIPTTTPRPTATPPTNPTPQPTTTPQPTATPQPGPTAQPTATPQPRPTRQPSATPQPTSTPVVPNPLSVYDLRESVPRVEQGLSHGSSVIFQTHPSDGGELGAFLLTNAHVVEGSQAIKVYVWDNDEWDFFALDGSVQGKDDEIDVAVLWACCDARLRGREASFGEAFIGEHVFILGYPYGRQLSPSITAGVISSRAVLSLTDTDIYLTDAPANAGNSGGPLMRPDGDVIGIITEKRVGIAIEGQATAIDVDGVRELVRELCDDICEIP